MSINISKEVLELLMQLTDKRMASDLNQILSRFNGDLDEPIFHEELIRRIFNFERNRQKFEDEKEWLSELSKLKNEKNNEELLIHLNKLSEDKLLVLKNEINALETGCDYCVTRKRLQQKLIELKYKNNGKNAHRSSIANEGSDIEKDTYVSFFKGDGVDPGNIASLKNIIEEMKIFLQRIET